MPAEQLSAREDLIENLDTDLVFAYLLQHGVLDQPTADDICAKPAKSDQNLLLLEYLEKQGGNAMALFINALRQSGQLHLASLLDVTQRIKPVYGSGYWEKQRHKGQVAIRIQVDAVKTLVPKINSSGQQNDDENTHNVEISFSPRRHNRSYENMTLIESPDEHPSIHPHRIQEFAYSQNDLDNDDMITKRSCWCMCFPRFFRRSKLPNPKKTPENISYGKTIYLSPVERRKLSDLPLSNLAGSSSPSGKKKLEMDANSWQLRNKNTKSEEANIDSVVQLKNTLNQVRSSQEVPIKMKHPGNAAILIQGYNSDTSSNKNIPPSPKQGIFMTLEETPVMKSPGKGKNIELAEEWRGDGEVLDEKAQKFYILFDNDGNPLYTNLIKYFEQDRGTLVLQAESSDSLVVFNICMTKEQLNKLQQDYVTGKLTRDIEKRLVNPHTLNAVDAKEMRLSTIIDDSEFNQAELELG